MGFIHGSTLFYMETTQQYKLAAKSICEDLSTKWINPRWLRAFVCQDSIVVCKKDKTTDKYSAVERYIASADFVV